MYIEHRRLEEVLKDYYMKYHKYMHFEDAVKVLYDQNEYCTHAKKIGKRNQLTHEEFLESVESTYIPVHMFLETTASTEEAIDSHLIPDNLNLIAFKQLKYKEQSIHPHNCFDFNYIYKGTATLHYENTTKQLNEGEVCLMTPKSKYRITKENEGVIILTIYIRNSTFDKVFFDALTDYDLISKYIRNVLYNQSDPNYLLFKNNGNEGIKEIIQNIVLETNYADEFSNKASIYWTRLLFIMILRNFSFEYSYCGLEKDKNIYFYQILDFVQDNFQTVTIKDISEKFHYNESYISTMFKNKMKMSFVDFLTEIKISKAKDLLRKTNLTIHEISQIVGYGSVDHFSRTFKKITSYTPGQFRQ